MREAIRQAVSTLGQELPPGSVDRFATLLEELGRWNRRINLTAIREPEAMITHHLLDSLAVRPLLHGTRVLDVGTGAGFPGLPLAIAEPGRSFTLLDSNTRKILFVEHVAALLQLTNVAMEKGRAEDYAPAERFDTVIARAVAPLPRLIAVAGHLVGEGGVFLALKGRYPAEELQQLPDGWSYSVDRLEVPGLGQESRHAVVMRRR